MKPATLADAPAVLNTNDRAMWVLGFNAALEARGVATQEHTGRVEATLPDDLADVIDKALSRAWNLGQTYWRQADSDSYKQNALSDKTQQMFEELRDQTRAAIAGTVAAPAEGQPTGNRCGCNHWMKPICPERHCSWQGKRPIDAGRVTAEGQPGTAGGKEGDRD